MILALYYYLLLFDKEKVHVILFKIINSEQTGKSF